MTVGCCVAVTFLQGLGSVRSIMKQHFPLVSGSAPMQLKGAVLGEREQCWARGLQPDQGRCACTSTSHKSSCCMATEQPSCRPCFWGRCTSIVCRVALTCCDWCSPTNTHWYCFACGVLQGLDEVVIATIMYPVLEALEYVHKTGIHRDVKVGTMCFHSVLAALIAMQAGRVYYRPPPQQQQRQQH